MQRVLKAWVFLPILARLALGAAFVLAGAIKLSDPAVLAATVEAFGLVPDAWAWPLARVLPPLEIFLGLACMLGFRAGLHGVTAMLAVFVAVLAYGLHLGLDIDCGCYGPADPMGKALSGLRPALYRDFFLLALAGLAYAGRKRTRAWPIRQSPTHLPQGDTQ